MSKQDKIGLNSLPPEFDAAFYRRRHAEEVGFIWTGEKNLNELIPGEMLGTFDACISSHTIEHTPDFVGFFIGISKLLTQDGFIRMRSSTNNSVLTGFAHIRQQGSFSKHIATATHNIG
jgi:hypothetical protein